MELVEKEVAEQVVEPAGFYFEGVGVDISTYHMGDNPSNGRQRAITVFQNSGSAPACTLRDLQW